MTEIKTKFICWGTANCFTVDKIAEIVGKVKAYADSNGYKNAYLISVEKDYDDKENDRYDVEITFVNNNGSNVLQKLLMLKGEIVDGHEFHHRFNEFYERRVAI